MQIKGVEIPQEIMEKAKDCKTAAELAALLKEHGIEATPEELEAEVRDLAPEDLEKAAGGSRMLLSAESGFVGRL